MIPGVERSQISFSFLQAYLAILLKHARLTVLLTAFSASVALAYYMYAKPIYHSQCLMEVKLLSKPTDDNVSYDQRELYYTLQQQLQSDHILERTARHLKLPGRYRWIRNHYCKTVQVRVTSDTNLEIDTFTYSYELAQKWPQALYEAFEHYRLEKRLERREHQIKAWIFDRQKVEAKLAELEKKRKEQAEKMKEWEIQVGLVALRKVPNELVKTRETLKIFDDIYKKLQDKTLDIEARLSLLERAQTEATVSVGEIVPGLQVKGKTEVYPQEGSSVVILPEMVTRPKEGWMELRDELNGLQEKLKQKLKVFRPAHPEIVMLKQQLNETKGKYEREILAMQNRFYAEYNHLKEKRQELEKKLIKLKELEISWEEYNQKVMRIKREMLPWEAQLQKLNKSLNEFDINEDRQLFYLRPPKLLYVSEKPEVPSLLKTTILMIAMSLF
ncbi:MAG: hypothetical protein D6820_08655, partial [Lentisphaerae bacterium]